MARNDIRVFPVSAVGRVLSLDLGLGLSILVSGGLASAACVVLSACLRRLSLECSGFRRGSKRRIRILAFAGAGTCMNLCFTI